MKKLLFILFALNCLLPPAQAQIAFTPAEFIQKIGAKKVGSDWKVGQAIIRFETLAGYAYKIEYIGSPTDTRFAAKAFFLMMNNISSVDVLEKEMKTDWIKKKDLGTFFSPGSSYDAEVDWSSSRLRFKVMAREITNLGQDRLIFGSSGVLMRVFSSFQCPGCKAFLTKVLPYLTQNYINTGKLRYSYRHYFASSIHSQALPAAIAAECSARQNKFWEYHLLLAQSLEIMVHAKALKFNSSFQKCLSDPTIKQIVMSDFQIASALGLPGTPTVLIGPFVVKSKYDIRVVEAFIKMAQVLRK